MRGMWSIRQLVPNTPEFQFVTFRLFSKVYIIEVVEAINQVMKSLVVLFFNVEAVISIVNGFDAELRNITVKAYILTLAARAITSLN